MLGEKKRNGCLIALCWFVYVSTYLGKYSYNANINMIMPFFNVNHAEAGLVSTLFFFSYGAGQIIHGILSKRYNSRYCVSGALVVSAAINVVVRFISVFYPIKYLWILNGFTLSMIWPLIVKTLAENLEPENFDKAIVIMGTTTPVGLFLAYGLSSLYIKFTSFRAIFTTGFIVSALAATVWFIFYPVLARGTTEASGNPGDEKSEPIPRESVLTRDNLLVYIIVLAVMSAVSSIIRDGIGVWFPSVLIEKFNFDESVSVVMSLVIPLLGIAGNFVGVAFNKKIKDFIPFGIVMMAATALFVGMAYAGVAGTSVVLLFAGAGISSCLLYGFGNIMTGKVPMSVPDKKTSGFYAGVMNGAAYAGSTISTYGLGLIADKSGWNGTFLSMLVITAAATVASAIFFAVYRLVGKKVK